MHPTIIPALVVVALVLLAALAVLVMLAVDRGDPAETAVAYELAWDRFDFELVWMLSAPEMRDGRDQAGFAKAKREAYGTRAGLSELVERVVVERLDRIGRRARVVTRLQLRDGGEFRHELRLHRDHLRWVVDSYRTGPDAREPAPLGPSGEP